MIYMGMGQKDVIHHSLIHRQIRLFIALAALFHTTVYQNMLISNFQTMTAPGYLMGCPNKS